LTGKDHFIQNLLSL